MTDEELRQIIKENKEVLNDIDKRMHRIEKKFIWNSIFGFIKTVFILAPLIIGAIYLTPFFKDFIEIYKPIYDALPNMFQNVAQPVDSNDPTTANNNTELMLESFCNTDTRQLMIDQLCK